MINFNQLLNDLKINLAISFYCNNQVGILHFEKSTTLTNVPIARPMGICLLEDSLAIASKSGISFFTKIYHQAEDKYLFLDGNLLKTTTQNKLLTGRTEIAKEFKIRLGNNGGSESSIDRLRIYHRALSALEIKALAEEN